MRSPKKQKTKHENKIVLYSYWRSSCSWRVRIALNLKQLEYEYVPIHLLEQGGRQFTIEHTERNPNQRVPVLYIDNVYLTQSYSMLEYVEETRSSSRKLLPTDPIQKAYVRDLCLLICCDIQPVQNLAVLKKICGFVQDEEKAKVKVDWGQEWIRRGFVAFEKLLEKTAKKYCVGDEITLADVVLVPQVYNAKRFEVDLSSFPLLSGIHDRLEKLPDFQAAHPDKMKDAA